MKPTITPPTHKPPKRRYLIHLFTTLRKYAPSKKQLIIMLVFAFISKAIWLASPYFFGKIITLIQTQGAAGRDSIFWWMVCFFCLTPVGRFFHGIARVREEKIKFQTHKAFVNAYIHKTMSLPMQRHTDNHSGATIDKINKSSDALREFTGTIYMYFYMGVNIIGAGISLSLIRWPAGVLVMVLLVTTYFIVNAYDKHLNRYLSLINEKKHHVTASIFDFLSNIKTVITLRFEDRAQHTINQKMVSVYPPFVKYAKLNERKRFTTDMVNDFCLYALVLLFLWVTFKHEGTVLLGTVTMLWQYTERMKNGFDNFNRLYGGLMQFSTDLTCIDSIDQAYMKLQASVSITFDAQHPIHITHLHFAYQAAKQNHTLQDISLDLMPGKRIALVGSSGSGKSTLMMLLRGLYPVDRVQVQIGDQQFDSLAPLSHYASLIPQDPEIFEQTIRYNITMGLDVDDSTVMHYARLARFDDVIAQLPHGLDTDIKEKGVNLSGGQKQRLALARGLLMSQDSRLILLDESTSSVDIENEQHIYQNIFGSYADACIVASIHKLHLLANFDYIYVLDKGKCLEQGTWSQLTANHSSHLYGLRTTYQTTFSSSTHHENNTYE